MNDIQIQEYVVLIPNEAGDAISARIPVMVPMRWDAELEDFILTPEAHKIIDDTKARHMGLVLPDEIKALRIKYGFTQKEISERLQIGEKSWVRWETGQRRPSRSSSSHIRSFFAGLSWFPVENWLALRGVNIAVSRDTMPQYQYGDGVVLQQFENLGGIVVVYPATESQQEIGIFRKPRPSPRVADYVELDCAA